MGNWLKPGPTLRAGLNGMLASGAVILVIADLALLVVLPAFA